MDEPPFKVNFIDPREIRMGSPYNQCQVEIIGASDLKPEKGWWQDIHSWNKSNSKLALVKWNLDDNEPGFHIVVFDLVMGARKESQRIFGCLNTIEFKTDNKIVFNKFKYTGKKTSDGELDGNFDEEIEI